MRSIDHRFAIWLAIAALTTVVLAAMRASLDKSHYVLAYLLVVLTGTSRIGRRGGFALAFLCFFCLNFFLLPPYQAFTVQDPRDWFVLFAFLATAVVAAQLLYRAQNQTDIAHQRSREIERLSRLGAETLSAGRAEDAVEAVARVMQSTLNLGSCEIHLLDDSNGFRLLARALRADYETIQDNVSDVLFEYVVAHEVVAVQRIEGSIHVLQSGNGTFAEAAFTQRDARSIMMPLLVRDRAVGLLRMSEPNGVVFDEGQRRFAETLGWYAALSVERVRLTAEAEHAAALAASNRVKSEFIAAASHDLRTPLTAIRGLAHELSSTGDERALAIESEAQRLNHMVADLLDLSTLNAGALEIQPAVNVVEDLVGTVLDQFATTARAADLNVAMPAGELVLARFDFAQSLRVLVNLVDNALKYSAPGSPVDITVETIDGMVAIAVSDRGPGIPPDDAARVFEPFVRLSHDPRDPGGAGLGLAIAKRIAVAQGSAINFTPRDGVGSVFTFLLPAVEHTPATPARNLS